MRYVFYVSLFFISFQAFSQETKKDEPRNLFTIQVPHMNYLIRNQKNGTFITYKNGFLKIKPTNSKRVTIGVYEKKTNYLLYKSDFGISN